MAIGYGSMLMNSWRANHYTAQPVRPEILTPKITPPSPTSTSASVELLPSRTWLRIAEQIVKNQKLHPTEAARLYAYIATTYYETLRLTQDQEFANAATKSLLQRMYPPTASDALISKMWGENFNPTAYQYLYTNPASSTVSIPENTLRILSPTQRSAVEWLQKMIERERTDGFYSSQKEPVPKIGGWNATILVTPHAGDWQRWIIPGTMNFKTPLPPTSGSPAYREQIEKLKTVTAARTSEQQIHIQTWSGTQGTITVTGIWQEVLWELFQKTASNTDGTADLGYAYQQKILAQGLADVLSENWKIKHTYWRARPFMIIPGFSSFSPTPHSPSYPGEHAGVAAAASRLLKHWYPQEQTELLEKARIARDSTVWSGTQFMIDTQAGFELGEKMGAEIINMIEKNGGR